MAAARIAASGFAWLGAAPNPGKRSCCWRCTACSELFVRATHAVPITGRVRLACHAVPISPTPAATACCRR
ncbi:hypothetical protein Xseb_13810 [Xanthomonas citri pv. sesbaniae]|uniref:Uncharacterized protein n=1 Tax=Xanthomonas citri pv. sesbaniae TaxID=473425 RepID=A0AAW4RLF9_XANCI|nr:hypothetical protein [Xanthomonas citri pv. sesbaniae]